jgi:predicted nucleotidyltransferase
MLERLVSATGWGLDLVLQSSPPGPTSTPGERLRSHRRRVKQIIARHGLAHVRVFGSIARGDDRPDSDIDLLVDVPPGVGLFRLGRCQAELECLLGARVDLIPAADLKPNVASAALAEAREL